jgi:hypothetical protein
MDEFSRAFCEAVGKHFMAGPLELPTALGMLLDNLTNRDHGMKVTFFFPDYAELDPVDVTGVPPPEGAEVHVDHYKLTAPDRKEYKKWMSWRVKSVHYSVNVTTDHIEALRMLQHGQSPNSYRAEVMLYRGRRWSDAYPIRGESLGPGEYALMKCPKCGGTKMLSGKPAPSVPVPLRAKCDNCGTKMEATDTP